MAVGHTHPNLYVGNGVTYDCMKVIASAMLDVMIKEEGGKIYRVLTHIHNLVPYSDKLFISTVVRTMCVSRVRKGSSWNLARKEGMKEVL